MPRISVIIPVRNGASTLEKCLRSIREQSLGNIEIIILDSMSTDNSKLIAEKYHTRFIEIPDGTFNHGVTRNLGAQYATADLLYYTVQDVWMEDKSMLERMALHFADDEVQAVAGHQVTPWGHPDKNPVLWFKRITEPVVVVRHYPGTAFENLTQKEQFELSGWDDVNAMYRKTALFNIPFRETNFSEDWLWANDALRGGYKILYDPSLVVNHYHHMDFTYTFKSKFIVNYYLYKFFNQLPVIPWSPFGMLRATFLLIRRNEVPIKKKPYWIYHNIAFHVSYFLSVLLFRSSIVLGKNRLLNKTYMLVCKEIPQGKLKDQRTLNY